MKEQFVSPFLKVISCVLTQVLADNSLSLGKPVIRPAPHFTCAITSIVGITGALRGQLFFDLDKKAALTISSVMNGEEIQDMNSLVRSTINEIANMITGNLVGKLSELGFICDVTPPLTLIGSQSELYSQNSQDHLIIPITSRFGIMSVSIVLEEE